MTTPGDERDTRQDWPGPDAANQAAEAERTTMLDSLQQGQGSGSAAGTARQRPVTRWHGGLDLGLLVLRVVLGATMLGHGLRKLFGVFDGPGIGGFADMLGTSFGFTGSTTLLSWVTALTESLGGVLLIVGLFTPLAAAGLLGVAASVVYVRFGGGFFGEGAGFEYELLLAACAFGVLFTGPGRVSVDVNTPWRRRPVPFGIVGLLLAAAGCVVIMLLFR